MGTETAVIIGAGPAGLTAAHELLHRTGIRPIVLESSDRIGGLSATIVHKGNRIDIGGHRFFSKSERVMSWWMERLPLQRTDGREFAISYQGGSRSVAGSDASVDPAHTDQVMLVRERRSRIFWRRKLFDYPLSASPETLRKMGLYRAARAGLSYGRAALMPLRSEETLEDFLINRFGRELYRTFFRDYTQKVWGVPCSELPAEWGAQRIKALSIRKLVTHALSRRDGQGIAQQDTETSLIERFLYPKYGPGQMWETTADEVCQGGGEILTGHRAEKLLVEGDRVVGVRAHDTVTGVVVDLDASYVFSTMPVSHLTKALDPHVPDEADAVAQALPYRDFFTIGLLCDRLALQDRGELIRDNWIYIQEPGVNVGRLQIFNNWSPWMVADPSKVWLGLEYFCTDKDRIWSRPDDELVELGTSELHDIGVIDRRDAIDGCVVRVRKAYPAYFGSYARFEKVRAALDRFTNLYCIGRNGQHRYNNQDHSMLCAMTAVDSIIAGRTDHANVWAVNTESDYHEQQ